MGEQIIDRPRISGLTSIHNGIQRDYPFMEAIGCLLNICDEVVVVDAASTDNTRDMLNTIQDPKMRVVDGKWKRPRFEGDGGFIIAENQNIGYAQCKYPWVLLLQADEGLHEKYKEQLYKTITEADKDPAIQAIRFRYYHFWGCYTIRQKDEDTFFYKESCRAFRRTPHLRSTGDGLGWDYQGFPVDSQRQERGEIRLPCVRDIKTDMYIYHYGYTHEPMRMAKRQLYVGGVFHTDEWLVAHNYPITEDQVQPRYFGLENATPNFPCSLDAHPAPWRDRIIREQKEGWIPEQLWCL